MNPRQRLIQAMRPGPAGYVSMTAEDLLDAVLDEVGVMAVEAVERRDMSTWGTITQFRTWLREGSE